LATEKTNGNKTSQPQGSIAIYARISKEDPRGGEGSSIESQVSRCKDWLKGQPEFTEADLSSIRYYRDDGYSGKNTDRPDFQRLMNDARKGLVRVVVFTELSRVSRSTADFLHIQSEWDDLGVLFSSLREKFDTTSPHGKLILTILAALNEFEREQTALRTRLNMRARAEKGLFNGGSLPIGYVVDPDHAGHLVVVEEQARMVREAFEGYLATGAPAKAAEILNERGYRTPDGRKFTWNIIYHMIGNPSYLGLKEINRANRTLSPEEMEALPEDERYKTVPAVWPAIIDEMTWERAQALQEGNKTARNAVVAPMHHDYVLTGIIRCGGCGVTLQGAGAKGQKYFYYQHPTGTKKPECQRGAYHAEPVEEAVLSRLRAYVDDKELLDRVIAKANLALADGVPAKEQEVEDARKKVRRLETQRDNFMGHLRNAPPDAIPPAFWDQVKSQGEEIKAAERNIRRLEEELEELRSRRLSPEIYRKALRQFNGIFAHLNPHDKRRLLAYFLDSVEVDGDQLKIALLGEDPQALELGQETEKGSGNQYRTPYPWLPAWGATASYRRTASTDG